MMVAAVMSVEVLNSTSIVRLLDPGQHTATTRTARFKLTE